jgi:hypothetical protein
MMPKTTKAPNQRRYFMSLRIAIPTGITNTPGASSPIAIPGRPQTTAGLILEAIDKLSIHTYKNTMDRLVNHVETDRTPSLTDIQTYLHQKQYISADTASDIFIGTDDVTHIQDAFTSKMFELQILHEQWEIKHAQLRKAIDYIKNGSVY